MNKTLRTFLGVTAVLISVVALVGAGFAFGRTTWGLGSYPGGMMGNFSQNDQNGGYDMMGGSGMMGGYGIMGGSDMMSGQAMMGGYGSYENVEPLSVDETRKAVERYLVAFGDDDLVIEEIMVFNNNAYAIVIEKSTGIGAFELLVDPVTNAVFPEYGPNMMWNLKYGMHAGGGYGMMGGGMMGGGMMGGGDFNNGVVPQIAAELTISADDALRIAQDYLDTYNPGVVVADEITTFYGYYTVDLEQDGETIGMLSVNGYSGQVFPHTWHGEFIEMVHELDHE